MSLVQIVLSLLLAVLPACGDESDTNCGWNSATRGNGTGASYVDIGGRAHYIEAHGQGAAS